MEKNYFKYPKFPKRLRALLRELAHKKSKEADDIYLENWRKKWNKEVSFLNKQK